MGLGPLPRSRQKLYTEGDPEVTDIALRDVYEGLDELRRFLGEIGGLTPIGGSIPYGGSDVPDGWLAHNGAAVSRATYPKLFKAIGTKFGAGDGSTTFNVPNTTGKAIRGGSVTQIGATGGAETHDHFLGSSDHNSQVAAGSGDSRPTSVHGHNASTASSWPPFVRFRWIMRAK